MINAAEIATPPPTTYTLKNIILQCAVVIVIIDVNVVDVVVVVGIIVILVVVVVVVVLVREPLFYVHPMVTPMTAIPVLCRILISSDAGHGLTTNRVHQTQFDGSVVSDSQILGRQTRFGDQSRTSDTV